MEEKSKSISGLTPVTYYSDEEKIRIIEDYISSGLTKREIWEKYTGRSEEHGQLLRWMRKLGYDNSNPIRRPKINLNILSLKKGQDNNTSESESFESMQLKKRVQELEKQLKEAEMKAIAFSTMVDIAEKEFKIKIRKKFNTKPLK